jgi:hypothetical protein
MTVVALLFCHPGIRASGYPGSRACAAQPPHSLAHAPGFSRVHHPEVSKSRGSAGARRPPSDFVTSRQSSGARVRWSARPRVQQRRQRASDPVRRRSGRRTIIVQDRWRLRSVVNAGAPLTKGVRASHCWGSPGLDRRPRNLRRAILTTDARTESAPASTGHRPCPTSDAQLLRPSYRARCGKYGGGFERGD